MARAWKRWAAVLLMLLSMACGVSASASANVAALMYHSVTRDASRWDNYTVSPDTLDADIGYFLSNGYITMTAAELAFASAEDVDGRNILLLTFDDGYSNFYTDVFPILKKYNAKATMYLIGSYINRYGYLTEDEVREMAHSGLVEIGNHTNSIHHTPKELLEGIYNDPNSFYDVLEDIKNNGERLKSITGIDVVTLSWPYGYYTPSLDEAVKSELGYGLSVGTEYGVNKWNAGMASEPLKRMNREASASTEEVFNRAYRSF